MCKATPHSLIYVLLALAILGGCTRNRPTPEVVESTPVASGQQGSAEVAPAVEGNAEQGANSNPSGAGAEPEVVVEAPTAAADGGDGSNNAEPNVAVEQPTVPAPEAVAEPTPTAPTPDAFPYTVTAGDSVVGIAELFGVTPDVIRELNFLASDNIQAGQILRIPRQPGAAAEEDAAASESGSYAHVVQPGDTLYAISVQYDVDAGEIIAANNLSSPDDIIVGQELIIPGYAAADGELAAGGAEEGAGGQVVHVVQPGDQLFAIAQRYGVTSAALIEANSIQNPGLLRIGQRLIIPGITEQQAAAATGRLHVVQPGEGLGQIAAAYGVTIQEIASLNNLGNVEIIYPGQELIIPGN